MADITARDISDLAKNRWKYSSLIVKLASLILRILAKMAKEFD